MIYTLIPMDIWLVVLIVLIILLIVFWYCPGESFDNYWHLYPPDMEFEPVNAPSGIDYADYVDVPHFRKSTDYNQSVLGGSCMR